MLATTPPRRCAGADRLGIGASTLCAVHCAASPLIALLFPALAAAWSAPAVHLLAAVLVVPLALLTLHRGRHRHGRRWPLACGWIGSLAIVAALLPAWSALPPLSLTWGEPGSGAAACSVASCCPTLTCGPGGWIATLPWSAALTLVGSIALIAGHAGNLWGCARCHGSDPSPASDR